MGGGGRIGGGGGGGSAGPSPWARERFGEHAAALAAAVPVRLAHAHARARTTHEAAGLRKRGPYGDVLAEAVREELAEQSLALGGAVRELRGFSYAVINDHALFPYRYANRPLPLGRARLPARTSQLRRRMFAAHGPEPDEGLFPLDETLTGDAYEQLHEAFEELGSSTTLVSVFYTADVEHGVHTAYWGDARLEPDRTFTWSHVERLPNVAA